MHTIDIYRGADLFVTIKPDDSSVQVKRIMGENQLQIQFRENRNIIFKINDYCTVFGEVYKLNQVPTDKKVNKNLFEYNLIMEAEGFDLAKANLLFLGADNTLRQPDFSLMGTIQDFLALVVENANRVSPTWVAGETIPSGFRNMDFSNENCYNALVRISQEFETEFWIEGKKIHLTKKQHETGYTFKHGKDKGLREITRMNADNSRLVTRLYVQGAEKNLATDYRNYSRRLKMPDDDYIELNTGDYGVIEAAVIFDDIYPHRTGTVSSISALDPFAFTDTSMDFNVNDYLLPGATAKVVFNTGQLSGYSFEIASFNNTTKQFRINKNKDEKNLDVPSTILKPAIGDKYVLVDIKMPQTYIDAAELELKNRAIEHLAEYAEPRRDYTIELDPAYMRKTSKVVSIGDVIWIVDAEFQINRAIRVVSVTRGIVNEFDFQIDLSDGIVSGVLTQINSSLQTNSREIGAITRHLENGSLFNNRVIGEFFFESLPTTSSITGKTPLYVDNNTGKLYRVI